MRVLFKDNDDVYKWLVSIEQEREELRDMNVVYAERSANNYRNYEQVRRRAITTMRRIDAHKIRPVDPKHVKTLAAKHEDLVRRRQKPREPEPDTSFLYDHPVRPQSQGWPVRKSGASRVFSPKKLDELKDFEDVLRAPRDQPIIHGTGIQVVPVDVTRRRVARPTTAPVRSRTGHVNLSNL